jgi:Carboxypeptidase regulatory-like domain
MQASTPGKASPRRWRRAWPLACALAAIAALLFFRARPEAPAPVSRPQAAAGRAPEAPRRAGWRHGRAPVDQAPAAMPAIRGTVYDLDGSPVAGATISASMFQIAGNVPTVAGSADSGEGGRFELRLPEGSYYLNGAKEGYGPAILVAHTGDDIGVILPKSGVVVGHVYDEQHRPITRFTIDVLPIVRDSMAAPAPLWSKRFESPDGSFRADRLPRSPATLRATAEGYAASFTGSVSIPAGSTKEIDLTLSAGCTLTGTAVDERGKPVPDVFVDAEARRGAGMMGGASLDAASQAQTDLGGRFRLDHVGSGEILVRAYDGSHAVTTASVQVASCDDLAPIQLKMSQGGALAGVIRREDGTPIAGAKLTLSHRSIGILDARSDAEGRYRFADLPAQTMRLEVQQGGHQAAVNVAVKDGETLQKDLTLLGQGSGELRGRITAAGKPLQGMQLHVATARFDESMDIHFPTTDQDGNYSVTGLAPGGYLVLVTSAAVATTTSVEDGKTATLDIDVAEQPQPAIAVTPPPQPQPAEEPSEAPPQ